MIVVKLRICILSIVLIRGRGIDAAFVDIYRTKIFGRSIYRKVSKALHKRLPKGRVSAPCWLKSSEIFPLAI